MKYTLWTLLLCANLASAQPVDGSADALNAYRAQNGLGAVAWHPALQKAAQSHADDMMQAGFFAHTSPTRGALGRRLRAQGIAFCRAFENIAYGQTSLAEAMQSWVNSPPHRMAMLSRNATHFAVAKTDQNQWVMMLIKPGC